MKYPLFNHKYYINFSIFFEKKQIIKIDEINKKNQEKIRKRILNRFYILIIKENSFAKQKEKW